MARALCHLHLLKATIFCLPPAQPAVEAPKHTSADKRKEKSLPSSAQGGKKEKKKKVFFICFSFSAKRMREDNGIISRWFSNCIMCSLEGLTLFGSKTYVLRILIGPIKLATLHNPSLPECWLCAFLLCASETRISMFIIFRLGCPRSGHTNLYTFDRFCVCGQLTCKQATTLPFASVAHVSWPP